jgi:hypothetical protein
MEPIWWRIKFWGTCFQTKPYPAQLEHLCNQYLRCTWIISCGDGARENCFQSSQILFSDVGWSPSIYQFLYRNLVGWRSRQIPNISPTTSVASQGIRLFPLPNNRVCHPEIFTVYP